MPRTINQSFPKLLVIKKGCIPIYGEEGVLRTVAWLQHQVSQMAGFHRGQPFIQSLMLFKKKNFPGKLDFSRGGNSLKILPFNKNKKYTLVFWYQTQGGRPSRLTCQGLLSSLIHKTCMESLCAHLSSDQ